MEDLLILKELYTIVLQHKNTNELYDLEDLSIKVSQGTDTYGNYDVISVKWKGVE